VTLFAGYFWPWLEVEALRIGSHGITSGRLLSVLVILGICAINCLEVRRVGQIQILLTSLKVLALVAVVGAGLLLSDGTGALHQQTRSAAGTWSLGGFTAAVTASLWAYSGWHTIFRVGGEVKDPGRTLPTAIGGFLATAAIFLLVNLACFSV
jgi:APA family basic amino acid/polyamine antiporter